MKLVWTILITGFLAVAAWADDLTLSTDKPFYAVGERAVISAQFDTDEDSPREFYMFVYRNQGHSSILSEAIEWDPTSTTNTWTWNLRDESGRAVTPGTYKVVASCQVDDDEGGYYDLFEAEISFEIVARTSSGSTIVRTTKREYARGELVKFYAINRTSRARSLPSTEPWTIFSQESDYAYFAPVAVAIAPGALEARGGRRMWSWDQKKSNGRQARNGRYTVEVILGTAQRPDPYYRSFRIVAANP